MGKHSNRPKKKTPSKGAKIPKLKKYSRKTKPAKRHRGKDPK